MRLPRDPKRKRFYFLLPLAVILLIAAVISGYMIYKNNRITKFDIKTESLTCADTPEINGFLQSQNLNYFTYSSDALEASLKKRFFCIGSIEQKISYPDKLSVDLKGREAKFLLKTIHTDFNPNPQIVLTLDQLNATQSTSQAIPPKVFDEILETYREASSSSYVLVDSEGVVFQETNSDNPLPTISIFSKDFKIGQTIPDNLIQKVSEIVEKLKNLDTVSDNLLVVGDRLVIDSKPRITFALNRPIDRQAASLQLILRQAKMNLDPEKPDSRSVESVDLRFDRPVVIYSK